MTPVTSLALRTDLSLLTRSGSTVEDYGTHLVVRTPDNPTYYWGNFLALRALPFPGGAREVMAACDAEFPTSRHRAITFDLTGSVDAGEFVAAGMTASDTVAMTATALVPPPRPNADAELRPFASDDDWEQRVALALAVHEGSASHEAFTRGRVTAERALEAQGLGQRWGAFLDGRLVSTAALFTLEDGLARYQSVETRPDVRRQGLAGTLVHRLGEHGLAQPGVSGLVIVADADQDSARLYAGLGFAESERVTELLQVL
ncbi:GNAT family N-acetyltransferase [Nocardioides houyundeii]|uniref:GNAT family N-acetyltransferase n=1 Tax=Nocardioides houyundeii TaxID=2045452 RepID=UPI000C758CDC|nr:GNAT family N-acetyltransferase [Nocardioides houyundeii]